MEAASLPAQATQSSPERKKTRADRVRSLLEKGWTVNDIAKHLSKGHPRKERAIRSQIYRILGTDENIQKTIAESARGILIEGLGPASEGVSRRAARGRTDSAKLLFEASGFHNPKVQHQHSGEVKISLNIPRPQRELPENTDNVVDAEVVDD